MYINRVLISNQSPAPETETISFGPMIGGAKKWVVIDPLALSGWREMRSTPRRSQVTSKCDLGQRSDGTLTLESQSNRESEEGNERRSLEDKDMNF